MSDNYNIQNYINGSFSVSANTEEIKNINPSDSSIINSFKETSIEDVESAIDVAKKSQSKWSKTPAIERASYLKKIAEGIRKNEDEFVRIIVEEQGKIKDLAKGEVQGAANYLDYTAEWARRIEGEIVTSDSPDENIFIFKIPMGVVSGILPWNFPFFLIVRKLAPALVTGNTIVIKASEETSNNAYMFSKLLDEAGVPKGVVNFVYGRGQTVGKLLSSSKKIDMISFTGSVETGSAIMTEAAKNITKVNLELGGKAPALVLADADIDLAVSKIRDARVINSGQVCNCVERVYVDKKIVDEFTEKLTKAMQNTKFGNPNTKTDIDYGPLINEDGSKKVSELVNSAKGSGAEILTGGNRDESSEGIYYHPTVIANCKQDMRIIQEEIFGPVLPLVEFEDLDQAIEYANDSDYGLTSSIFTNNLKTALKACNEIRFGETMINRDNMEIFQSFHAGLRKSGIGGADGKHGLYEYMQTHAVYMRA